jgi:hypothetical protein
MQNGHSGLEPQHLNRRVSIGNTNQTARLKYGTIARLRQTAGRNDKDSCSA